MSRIHELRDRAAQRRAEYSHPDVDILGVDGNGLSPGEPGYDATTDPASSSYLDPNTYEDPSLPSPDASFDPPPIPAAPLNTTIKALPADAVVYDGSKGMPPYCVGSYSYWKGSPPEENGYVWGFDKINAPNSGSPARWIKVYGKRGFDVAPKSIGEGILSFMSAGIPQLIAAAAQQGNWNWDDVTAADLPAPAAASAAAGYGPLIGNPSMPDFANLRWATDAKQWFWYPSEAPEYATAESKRAIALLNQQTAQALADAQAAQKVLDDQLAAELAEAQAQQDLADLDAQHQQEQAQQAADAAAQVAATGQAQQEAAAQSRFAQQQQEMEMQAAQRQQEMDLQREQMEMQAAQADLDYMRAHPDEVYAEQAPPDRGTAEEPSEEMPSDRGTSEEEPSFEGDVFGASRSVERMRVRTGHASMADDVLGASRAVERLRARKRQ
jgi:hypothetical protein